MINQLKTMDGLRYEKMNNYLTKDQRDQFLEKVRNDESLKKFVEVKEPYVKETEDGSENIDGHLKFKEDEDGMMHFDKYSKTITEHLETTLGS